MDADDIIGIKSRRGDTGTIVGIRLKNSVKSKGFALICPLILYLKGQAESLHFWFPFGNCTYAAGQQSENLIMILSFSGNEVVGLEFYYNRFMVNILGS